MASAVLSGMGVSDLISAVASQEAGRIVKVPGIGKKTAERLIVEMRDKMRDWLPVDSRFALQEEGPAAGANSAHQEAESALISLGYKPVQASKSVAAALKASPEGCSEDLIRFALRGMI